MAVETYNNVFIWPGDYFSIQSSECQSYFASSSNVSAGVLVDVFLEVANLTKGVQRPIIQAYNLQHREVGQPD